MGLYVDCIHHLFKPNSLPPWIYFNSHFKQTTLGLENYINLITFPFVNHL